MRIRRAFAAGTTAPRQGAPWRLVAMVLVVAALAVAARWGEGRLPDALALARSSGPWTALVFVGLYATLTVALIPGSLLTLAAGAIYGLVEGTLYAMLGATLGAALSFLVARYAARDRVARRIGTSDRLAAVDRAVGDRGFNIVLLLRLSPVFPFNVLNYALGLTRVRLRDYLAATIVGMAPASFLYGYAGFAAGQAAIRSSASVLHGPGYYALLGAGLLATLAVTAVAATAARRALRQRSPT